MVKESKVKAQNSKVVKQANNRPKVVLGTGRYLAEIDSLKPEIDFVGFVLFIASSPI